MTLYVCAEPWVTDVLPVIVPGCPGTEFTVTERVLGELDPQALFAAMETLPPLAPTVVVMELVVDEPDQPVGNIQV